MIPMSPDYALDNIAFDSLLDNFSNLIYDKIKFADKRQTHSLYISLSSTILNVLQTRSKIDYPSILQKTKQYQTEFSKEYIATIALSILEDFRQQLSELIYSDVSYELAKHLGGMHIGEEYFNND